MAYVEIQRLVTLIEEAAMLRRGGFVPSRRLIDEFKRRLTDIPPQVIPESLRKALHSRAVLGSEAEVWLRQVRAWRSQALGPARYRGGVLVLLMRNRWTRIQRYEPLRWAQICCSCPNCRCAGAHPQDFQSLQGEAMCSCLSEVLQFGDIDGEGA